MYLLLFQRTQLLKMFKLLFPYIVSVWLFILSSCKNDKKTIVKSSQSSRKVNVLEKYSRPKRDTFSKVMITSNEKISHN